MEYITSQNSAGQSMDGCVQTSETSAACQQQQQQQQWDADAGSRVKLMVERLLSRLGLSALASLVDETAGAAAGGDGGDGGGGGRADVGVDVHVLRTQSRAADDDDDDQDQLLEQVGRSFGVLLQLLRRCTNWNDLLSADASLSDAVARLTEHELSGGAMGYGVQTDWSVRRLTSVLAVSSVCAGPGQQHAADTPPLTAASSSSLSSCDAGTTLAQQQLQQQQQQQQQLVAGAERRDVDELATRHRRRSVELQSTADTSSCRCADIGAALTSCAARRRPAVNRCCRVDQLYNEQACDNDEPFRVDSTQCSDMSPLSRTTTEN